MDGRTDSIRVFRVNRNAKGRGGKGSSKGNAGKSKGNAEPASSMPGGESKGNLKGLRSDKGNGKSDTHKGSSKGKAGKSKGNAESASSLPGGESKGTSKGLRSDKGKGKGDTHAGRRRLPAQECYSEPKCVMILQQRYGCQVGEVLDMEGQSRDGKHWLEMGGGGRTLPKCREGVGWKKLHGDVGRPSRIHINVDFFGCGGDDVVLRVKGETEDHRSWLTECGKKIPKAQINTCWDALDSSSAENRSCGDDSSSSGHDDYTGHQSLDSGEDHRHRVPSSAGSLDMFYDHERFPEYLRDERPDLDSDGLEDLYQDMLQDDAEEFAGYQCDSD